MKRLKYFLWFIKESPKYTQKTFLRLLLKEHLIKRGVSFTRDCIRDDKLKKKYGSDIAYAITNRVIEM